MFGALARKILGSSNDRVVKTLAKTVPQINALEPELEKLTDEQLAARTDMLKKRHEGLDPDVIARAWAAQLRLCGKFRRLDERKTNRKTVVTAIARELAGFVWAEMTAA